MKRAILAVLILSLGVLIGSCISVARSRVVAPATVQDWRPVRGQRYERPHARPRIVTAVDERCVTYHYDGSEKLRYCAPETWRRWAGGAR